MENISKYSYLLILFYYPILLFLYKYTNKKEVKYYSHSKIDDKIPLVKQMVIPYIIWYFYVAFNFIYLAFTSKEDFLKFTIFMFMGMTICILIYIYFPNGIMFRPKIVGQDILSKIIKFIYSRDNPTNCNPSIHVFNSIAVHTSLINNSTIQDLYFVKFISFIIMISIILSTVMIKQHSIKDVFYASILGLFFYITIYKLNILNFLIFSLIV